MHAMFWWLIVYHLLFFFFFSHMSYIYNNLCDQSHLSFCAGSIQERELYLGDFIENPCNIGIHVDAYEPVSFKLGIVLDTTIFHCLILV